MYGELLFNANFPNISRTFLCISFCLLSGDGLATLLQWDFWSSRTSCSCSKVNESSVSDPNPHRSFLNWPDPGGLKIKTFHFVRGNKVFIYFPSCDALAEALEAYPGAWKPSLQNIASFGSRRMSEILFPQLIYTIFGHKKS